MTNPVQEIKERLNIVDVVSSYVTLIPAGKNLKARSPFTNEKTPSFFVSPDKGLYHCFSTGKGGDIFTFVQEMEGLDFRGALKVLADKAGISLANYDPKVGEEKDRLYAAVEKATEFFEESLEASDEAKKYLLERGVEEKMFKEFRIGFAPLGWRNLYDELKNKFSDKDIVLSGLGKKTEKGIYDTFRDRIMFPIMDTAGRPIAFSGRILHPDEKSAKYVNSPDTPLFNKSDILFALDKAKNFIRKYNFTILVEGQFDVLMLHQAGFRNTVGVSGTALSDSLTSRENSVNNLGLVKRLSNNLILAFDSDGAGIKATKRSAEIALALGMDVKVVTIPGAKDPADFIKEGGKEAWSKVQREAKHIIEFITERIKDSARDTRDLGKQVVTEVLPLVAGLPSETEKSFFVKRISEMTEIPESVLWQDLEKVKVETRGMDLEIPKAVVERNRKSEIERKLLALFYSKPADEKFKTDLLKIMGEDKFKELSQKFAPIKDELIFEVETLESDVNPQTSMNEMFVNLEEDYLNERIEELLRAIKKAESVKDGELAEKLTEDYQNLVKRSSEIKNSRHLNKY